MKRFSEWLHQLIDEPQDISLDTLIEPRRDIVRKSSRAPETGKPSTDIVHAYTRATTTVADHAA